MKKEKELVIRLSEAEQDLLSSVNEILQKHNLPCYLFEPIMYKIHNQVINGKTSELQQATARANEQNDEQ